MTAVTNNSAANSASSSATSSAAAAQAQDTEFLSMLTTELTNQDPMNPTDTAQFTSQLVSMSSLEQQISTNSKLDGMTTLLTQLAASATSSTTNTSAGS